MRIAIITSAGILDVKQSWFFDNILKKYIIHNVYQDLANSERTLCQLTKDSKITYAIVRPPQLVDSPITLDFEYGEDNNYPKGSSKVTRQDVASFLLRSLFDEKLQGNRSFNLNSKREIPTKLDIDEMLKETLSPTLFIIWKVLKTIVKIGLTGLVLYSLKTLFNK
ncbi:predicted protein [Naegleria gruberi]|uniref:Predicted protein n=1 Tax=Naegleria gruberi TaxID=5762 RepID=D2W6I2_NAEGR|nr:uncharacterized protein NAEGRDRAFT_77026 [Naegleria gruberi]EFC35320.1 predicted protein [Naegleria gruberi]|eukprot:XP_002668064.1 predicted protein [Naegleria gruberi strain NEG-M]